MTVHMDQMSVPQPTIQSTRCGLVSLVMVLAAAYDNHRNQGRGWRRGRILRQGLEVWLSHRAFSIPALQRASVGVLKTNECYLRGKELRDRVGHSEGLSHRHL